VGEAGLPDSAVEAVRDAHAASSMPVCKTTDGAYIVLCAEGRVGPGKFLDSKGKRVITVNMVTGEATDAAATEGGEAALGAEGSPIGEVRAALASAAEEMAASSFQSRGTRHGAGDAFVGSGGSIVVVLSGVKARVGNFWAAQWRSRWRVTGGAAAAVSGRIEVVTHCFENGNVQMHAAKDVPAVSLEGVSGAAGLAAAARGAIHKAEDAFQQAVMAELVKAQGSTLQELRRGLPVSGTPMVWKREAHRVRTALAGKGGE